MKKILLIVVITCFMVYNITFGVNYVIDVSPDNKEYSDLLFKGYDYYKDGNYERAVNYYEQAYDICGTSHDCDVAENLLVSVYYILANNAYESDDNEETIRWYKKLLAISPNEFSALVNIGIAYIWDDPELALSYLKEARKYVENQEDAELLENNIKSVEEILANFDNLVEEKEFKALHVTNDSFVYKQYYLYYLNVFDAWKKIPVNDNIITVAIIDDGIKFDHPDLKDSIWTNDLEKLGNRIDDDGNGYIDDYFGWNFVKNSSDVTPIGSHGTMIAGILGATSNNGVGIAGIIPNGRIKLMSLIAFGEDGKATNKDIIKAMNYAIDNGADIINLSLGGELHEYSHDYDEVIKRANDKGIVIMAAAGNGDETKNPKVGINTSDDLLSPVCNGDYNYSVIGVGSLDKTGNISSRSNYGDCIDVYTYGESIFSTSSTGDTLHAIGSGTSFSTPIVAGIIGLGYLKYGNIGLSDIYKNIKGSLVGNTIDAVKYLDNLGKITSSTDKDNDFDSIKSVNLGGNNNIQENNEVSELEAAINWMYENGLTIYSTPQTFMNNAYLTREQASKFFVEFATLVLGRDKGLLKSYDIYSDISNADPSLKDHIIYASNMGLFKGNNGKFMPFNNLSQAQALAVTIRMLDGYLDESDGLWYSYYFYRAQEYGLLSRIGIKFITADETNITRGDMALILYNAYRYYNNIK